MVKKTRDYPRRRRKLSSFFLRLVRTRPDLLDPAVTIPLLNGIDMFAVSLVVPLLFQYYKAAGVTSANQRELLSSVFSASQIFGGLLLGTLSDAKLVRRKTVLLVSFGGSAVSYALIVFGGLYAILLSRVLVGLVKQTMTVCTAILTRHTTKTNRAHILGRLTASSTVAWIVGPTVGAMLYKYVDPRAPALVACLLFVGNVLLAMIVLAPDDGSNDEDDDYSPSPVPAMDHPPSPSGTTTIGSNKPSHTSTSPSKCSVILNNLRVCFSSKALGSAVITKLLLTWITKATNYSQLGSFYEDMYGLEPHHRGYISSYQQLLQFFVNIRLVSPILDYAGGERWATLYCVSIMAAAVYLESFRSLPLFLVVLCPIISLSFCISDLSLQTLVTHVAPPSSMFSVLAALDVLQNMVSVSVPFYRTWLFSHLQKGATTGAMMQGDPDPVAWVKSSSLHWCVTAAVLSLLLTNESWWIEDHRHHVKMPSKKGR
jgi:MFS family permease